MKVTQGLLPLLGLCIAAYCQPKVDLPKVNLIESVRIHKNRLDVAINNQFKEKYLTQDFFIEYDESINLEDLDYSIAILPFIMNVISLVWVSGKDYYVDSMDSEVVTSLEKIKKMFKIFYPKTAWNGRLIPRKVVKNKPIAKKQPPKKIALLFSCGVDSTASSLAHRDKQQLLITAWGQSALPLDNPTFWNKNKSAILAYSKEHDHTNMFIKSNYYYFLNFKKLTRLSPEILTWRIDTIEDIGWAGMVAPILITHQVPVLHIASTETWDFPYPSAANPFIDACISFAGIRVKHDQFELSRFDKISLITHFCSHRLTEKPQLIVCQKKGDVINCNRCEKCLLTALSLFGLGANPAEYGFSLSLDDAKKNMIAFFNTGRFSSSGLWQFKDLQKKLRALDLKNGMGWFKALDFTGKKPYDIKKARPIDWSVIERTFPELDVQRLPA